MSSAIPGSLEEFSGAVLRLFPLICGPDAPRNGSPGGERGFQCPVINISGGQAGFKALERYSPSEAVKGKRKPQEYVSRGTTGPDGGLYIHAIEEVHQTKPRMR